MTKVDHQISLFPMKNKVSKIELIYSVEQNGMKATEVGEAIFGMSTCLKEAARSVVIDFDDVFVLPIEEGSIITNFVFIKKDSQGRLWQAIVNVGAVVALVNGSFDLIQRFGANQVRNPTSEIVAAVSDPKIIKLCQSKSFRDGAKQIAQPLSEINEKVTVKYGDDKFEINCDNKYQFYETDDEEILPELRDGDEVELRGEITRINKRTNDLGFNYEGKMLSVSPSDEEDSIANYHQYLTADEVVVRGIVSRSSNYETPKIKILEISSEVKDQLGFDYSN